MKTSFWMRSFAGGAVAVLVILGVTGCLDGRLGWSVLIGSEGDDAARAMDKTRDGGYILAGFSEQTHEEDNNIRLTKMNGFGSVEWEATFGDDRADIAYDVIQTRDGGYVLAGGLGGETDDASDGVVIKTDKKGKEEWRTLLSDGDGHDYAVSVVQTDDDGYIVALQGDVLGLSKAILVKLDAAGKEQWRVVGAQGVNVADALILRDDNYLLAWWALTPTEDSFTGSISLLKVDTGGKNIWRKELPAESPVKLASLVEAADGGFALTGTADFLSDDSDVFLWKTDAEGVVSWSRTFGLDGRDEGHSVIITRDGGYAVAGEAGGSATHPSMLLLKANRQGDMIWHRVYGGNDTDIAYDLVQTRDGAYVLAGTSESYEEEDELDNQQIYVVKTGWEFSK